MHPKSFITLNARGGLANRMRAIASGVALAADVDAGVRILWIVNDELHAGFNDLFIPSPSLRIDSISSILGLFSCYPARKRNLYLSPVVRSVMFDTILEDDGRLPIGDPNEMKAAVTGSAGRTFIGSGLQFYPFSPELYKSLFQPRADICNAVSEQMKALGHTPIGFHIRRTDNKAAIAGSPLELFIEKAGELLCDSNVRIYLATDNNTVKQRLGSLFKDKIIYSPSAADRRSKNGMRQALAEMLILSRCSRIYGSFYSSFSEAAAMLGDVPLDILKVK